MADPLLHCPIRGQLRTPQRAKDGLRFTEEKQRIDALRFLLQRNYPAEHFGVETTLLRFGHKGRNAFRIDFAVYASPYEELASRPIEERLEQIRLVAEIKRENEDAKLAKQTQLAPAIKLLPDLTALGVYWDDIEQRFYYRTVKGNKAELHEAPISKVPRWGSSVTSTKLSLNDLKPTKALLKIFDQLEDDLHSAVADKSKRYAVLLQLLLMKIHDENRHKAKPESALDMQDFSVEPITDAQVEKRMETLLTSALGHYQNHLPHKISESLSIPPDALRRVTKILAPINILESRKEVRCLGFCGQSNSLFCKEEEGRSNGTGKAAAKGSHAAFVLGGV